MANLGMKYLRYAILNEDDTTYGTIKTMGRAISASVSPNIAEGSLYADDKTAEYATAFQSAAVTLGVDDDDDATFAELLGKSYDEATKIVSSSIDDNPPYVGFGYIVSKIKNNLRKYRAQFFTKMKFKPFIPESKTKGDSIEFGTPSVEGLTIANNAGIWESHVEKDTETEAITALDAFFVQETTARSNKNAG
jgi:phi13 family phage major tail protein